MQAHEIETTIGKDGRVTLESLPMQAGSRVRVIVLELDPTSDVATPQDRYPLRGKPYRISEGAFDGPAVPADDWEVIRG